MIDPVDVFLEHHGVKGQKWGVRRNKKTGVRPIAKTLNDSTFGKLAKANVKRHNRIVKKRNKKAGLTTAQRRERNVKRVQTGLAVAAGALYIASILSSTRKAPAREHFRSSDGARKVKTGAKSVKDIINAERDSQISSLTRMHKEGKMDKDQFNNFLNKLNARYDRKIMDL